MADEKKDAKDLVARIRKRYAVMEEADRDNRRAAMDDIKFVNVPGEQWDPNMKKERGERPCYEFNKLRVTNKRIINDMRANRPSGKVRAVEGGDKKTAEVYEGLIRNIWNTSDGDTVIDYAAEYQVDGGMGAWRVSAQYATDGAFEQNLVIEAIPNPFCLYVDPAAKDPLKRDAQDWLLTEKISKASYEERWPDANIVEFESNEFDDEEDWRSDTAVRVAEYWWKEPATKKLLLLSDGSVVDAETAAPEKLAELAAQGVKIERERDVKCHRIMSCIASGDAVLEGPTQWGGSQFPFIVVFGEHKVVDGKIRWHGNTRFAKDPQRSYNVSRTAIDETIALSPQSKFWATPEQALGHEGEWAEAHKKNYPFMLFNADPKNPGTPQNMAPPPVPVALIQQAQLASEEIKAVTGIFDASLGNQSNETSGRAISARQRQGEIATFNYMDNLAKGIRRTWEILIDLIPKYYDTQRTVRVLGVDGADDFVEINGPGGLHDLGKGRYDVTVTSGPSFATQRQEAAELYTEMAARNPDLMGIAGDLLMKAMDLPYADKIGERIKAMLPPQIQALESQGKNLPPEAMAAMAQADQAMQQVQQHGQLVQQAAQELEGEKAKIEAAKADLDLKAAKMEADYQRMIADITKREAAAGVSKEQGEVANDRATLGAQVMEAVAQIQQQAAEFMTQAAQVIAEIQARSQPQVVVANQPRRRIGKAKRINGELVIETMDVPDEMVPPNA